jgi:hypothetical protein
MTIGIMTTGSIGNRGGCFGSYTFWGYTFGSQGVMMFRRQGVMFRS